MNKSSNHNQISQDSFMLSKDKKQRKININFVFILSNFILSLILILILDNFILNEINFQLEKDGVLIKKINSKEVEEFLHKTNVYYDQYVLYDKVNEQFLSSFENSEQIIKKFIFANQIPDLLRYLTVGTLHLLFLCPLLRKSKFQKMLLAFNFFTGTFNLFIASEILVTHFELFSGILTILLVGWLFTRLFACYAFKIEISYASLFCLASWILELVIIPNFYTQIYDMYMIFYGINILADLIILGFIYIFISNKKEEQTEINTISDTVLNFSIDVKLTNSVRE